MLRSTIRSMFVVMTLAGVAMADPMPPGRAP